MTPLKKYICLIDILLRKKDIGLTLEQIGDYWDRNDEMSEQGAFSRRSFYRHRKEISNIFGIDIECYSNGMEHRYRIADSEGNDYFRRWLMDSISVNRAVMNSKDMARYIGLENSYTGYLSVLLQAMKDNSMIRFDYMPYWSEELRHLFCFEPHALKMFEHRWYLIGRYGNNEHRIYALDRISKLEIQEETFQRDARFNLTEMFEDTYGIIIDDKPAERILLKVESYQANYLRSLPLHSSQYEKEKNNDYSVFSLRLRPTFDFRQKLLSFGSSVEVLEPERLRNEMKEEAYLLLRKYQEGE